VEKVLQQILEKLNNMDSSLSNLEKGQEALRADVTGLQQGQQAQGQELKALRSDVARLEKNQQRLEARLEHEVIDKIKVLFDGHKTVVETLGRIEKKLDAHDARLDIHGNELARLSSR